MTTRPPDTWLTNASVAGGLQTWSMSPCSTIHGAATFGTVLKTMPYGGFVCLSAVRPAPVLIGYSSGATLMFAALAQAGDARFGGAMTLGFCPDLIIHKPFCAGAGLTADKQTQPPYGIVFNTVPKVAAPWIVLQGDIDQVCNPPATEAFVNQVSGGRV